MQNEKFIEMTIKNKSLKYEYPVEDEIVLIFDLDYCLFRNNEMYEYEKRFFCETFLKLSNQTDINAWHSSLEKLNYHYKKVFCTVLGIDPKEYDEREYEIPEYQKFLKPNHELNYLLKNIQLKKFCFTNGSKRRAEALLKHLEMEDLFEKVICSSSNDLDFISKPDISSYKFVEEYLGIKSPNKIYFFDDTIVNVTSANELGWNGVHVTSELEIHLKDVVNNIMGLNLNN